MVKSRVALHQRILTPKRIEAIKKFTTVKLKCLLFKVSDMEWHRFTPQQSKKSGSQATQETYAFCIEQSNTGEYQVSIRSEDPALNYQAVIQITLHSFLSFKLYGSP